MKPFESGFEIPYWFYPWSFWRAFGSSLFGETNSTSVLPKLRGNAPLWYVAVIFNYSKLLLFYISYFIPIDCPMFHRNEGFESNKTFSLER